MLVFTVDRTSCHLWVQFISDGWMVGFLRKVVEPEAEEEPEAPAATVVVVEGGKVDKGGYRTKNPRFSESSRESWAHTVGVALMQRKGLAKVVIKQAVQCCVGAGESIHNIATCRTLVGKSSGMKQQIQMPDVCFQLPKTYPYPSWFSLGEGGSPKEEEKEGGSCATWMEKSD